MAYEAQRKYLRQVRPHIGAMSPHGQVVHGYAVAFGSRPTRAGTFLRLSQTQRPRGKTPLKTGVSGDGDDNGVPAELALASHRSNFILLDALPIANWIDWLSGVRAVPDDRDLIAFVRFNYAGRRFLAYSDTLFAYRHPRFWPHDLFDPLFLRQPWLQSRDGVSPLHWFVMEENAATAFLNALASMIAVGPRGPFDPLQLPITDIAGFSFGAADRTGPIAGEGYDYALFGDGLALIGGPPPRRSTGVRIWHPSEGLQPPI
jgi:hypothetical protein